MNDWSMPGLESLAMAWAARGWLAVLAFTAAVLVVVALRKPCRRWFGAERAFQLWLLPPLAVLASQLPHAAVTAATLPPLVYTITSAVGATLPQADASDGFDWNSAALLLWLAGLAVVFVSAVVAQRRYRLRLRGAVPMADAPMHRPVWRAASADVGPALVGAWRSRIVLPADFHERYDATEQALILAHESAHARRGDGWWSLFAHAFAAVFWCHPLAWWALAALRHDQELACDAAVLRGHGAQRRSYANAMLKTQPAAFALPVGCAWSPRHPLTERIAMLKQRPVTLLRLRMGFAALAVVTAVSTSAVYAVTAPSGATQVNAPAKPDRYGVRLDMSFDGKLVARGIKLCLTPGEYFQVNGTSAGVPQWHGRFALFPTKKRQIEVRVDMRGGTLDSEVHPIVRTMPGQQATIQIGRRIDSAPVGKGDKHDSGSETSIKMDLTPSIGC